MLRKSWNFLSAVLPKEQGLVTSAASTEPLETSICLLPQCLDLQLLLLTLALTDSFPLGMPHENSLATELGVGDISQQGLMKPKRWICKWGHSIVIHRETSKYKKLWNLKCLYKMACGFHIVWSLCINHHSTAYNVQDNVNALQMVVWIVLFRN